VINSEGKTLALQTFTQNNNFQFVIIQNQRKRVPIVVIAQIISDQKSLKLQNQ
jgi:hypothetical protein